MIYKRAIADSQAGTTPAKNAPSRLMVSSFSSSNRFQSRQPWNCQVQRLEEEVRNKRCQESLFTTWLQDGELSANGCFWWLISVQHEQSPAFLICTSNYCNVPTRLYVSQRIHRVGKVRRGVGRAVRPKKMWLTLQVNSSLLTYMYNLIDTKTQFCLNHVVKFIGKLQISLTFLVKKAANQSFIKEETTRQPQNDILKKVE